MTYGYTNRQDCKNFGFGPLQPAGQGGTNIYVTEHILESQLVGLFLESINEEVQCQDPTAGSSRTVNLCRCMKPLWSGLTAGTQPSINISSQQISMDPVDWIGSVFLGDDNQWRNGFVLLEKDVNGAKQGMWGNGNIRNDATMRQYLLQDPDTAIKNLKDTITAIRYHADPIISARLIQQKDRVGNMLNEMDIQCVPGIVRTVRAGKYRQWQPQGLQQRWNTWIRAYTLTKAISHVETWLPQLEQAYATPTQRDNSIRGNDNAEAVVARYRMSKIDTLRNQWTNMTPA